MGQLGNAGIHNTTNARSQHNLDLFSDFEASGPKAIIQAKAKAFPTYPTTCRKSRTSQSGYFGRPPTGWATAAPKWMGQLGIHN
jgi:hypothetical protein